MVKENKSKRKKEQSKDDTKVAPSDLNLKSVTYEYDDGFCCTVVTSAEAPPSSAFNLITSTVNTNNMKKANTSNTSNTNSAATEVTVSSKPTATTASPRSYKDLRIGVKKKEAIEIVEQFNFPDRPFTIKEVLFATGINHWYVTAYIKANAKVVGNAPKQPGERGKVAKLYQIEKKA